MKPALGLVATLVLTGLLAACTFTATVSIEAGQVQYSGPPSERPQAASAQT